MYVFHFWVELKDLIGAAMGNHEILAQIFDATTLPDGVKPTVLDESTIMLVVLSLCVGVMVSAMESRIENDKAEKQKARQARVDAGLEHAPAEPMSRELAQVLCKIRQLQGEMVQMRAALE